MNINFLALILAAFSTLVIGGIWYNPKVFGTIWMRETGTKMEENFSKTKMFGMFAMAVFYAFLISFLLQVIVIHQYGALGMVGGDPSKALPSYNAFMADYGTNFRTFKHGMLHGTIAGLFFALPVVGTGAIFERRSWKYVLISGGYWVVCCMIMGGIICAMK
jgi:hypothetical protein